MCIYGKNLKPHINEDKLWTNVTLNSHNKDPCNTSMTMEHLFDTICICYIRFRQHFFFSDSKKFQKLIKRSHLPFHIGRGIRVERLTGQHIKSGNWVYDGNKILDLNKLEHELNKNLR